MAGAALLLALAFATWQDPTPAPLAPGAARFSELLAGEELVNATTESGARSELAALPDLASLVLATLADWSTPGLDTESDGVRLDQPRRDALVALVRELPAETFRKARTELPRATLATELRAGLRLEGALARASTVRALYTLALRARELNLTAEVEEAFAEGLALLLAREPKTVDVLRGAWSELPPELATSVLRALTSSPSSAAVECVRAWLGRRPELDAAVLLTLASLHRVVDPHRREGLVVELQLQLGASDPAVTQAAATALGRLGTPDSVPWLVETLAHELPAVQRAALAALREIGGVNLPGSTIAWRSWYAREETWYQEQAPTLLEQLSVLEESAEPAVAARALLRSLTEHRLHRDELVEHLRPLLEHELPRMRILACQGLERLASRRALPWLVERLLDPEPSVVSAAHAALCVLEGVRLGNEPADWCARLGLPLPRAD